MYERKRRRWSAHDATKLILNRCFAEDQPARLTLFAAGYQGEATEPADPVHRGGGWPDCCGRLPSHRHARGIKPMQDAPLLLYLLYAALMVSSMMLTLQVHRLRQPASDDNRTLGR